MLDVFVYLFLHQTFLGFPSLYLLVLFPSLVALIAPILYCLAHPLRASMTPDSMRVARGSASLLPSHGRGIWPRDVLKEVSRGLSRVEAGNPCLCRIVSSVGCGHLRQKGIFIQSDWLHRSRHVWKDLLGLIISVLLTSMTCLNGEGSEKARN